MEPDFYPPLRLATDRGEVVVDEWVPDLKLVEDLDSMPLVPIRPDIEIDLDPDFPRF